MTTLRSCLPSQTPPHAGYVTDTGRLTPVSARSSDALDAAARDVVERNARRQSADENAEDA